MPNRKAGLLKQQKGKCPWCGLHFREEDVMELDHKIPRALGGKEEWENLQLLHRHCHDEKSKFDLENIRLQKSRVKTDRSPVTMETH